MITPASRDIRLLAVHAHPDDEMLATGVTLAQHRVWGEEVHVITATLGEEGEVIPAELAYLEGSADLAEFRHTELAGAMGSLGVVHHYLGGERPRWRDSGMAGSPAAAHPRAFAAAAVSDAAVVLVEQIAVIAPDVVLTYDPQGGYAHPDHIQTHRVTMAALASIPAVRRPAGFIVLTPQSWARADRQWVRDHGAIDARLTIPAVDDAYPPSVLDDAQVPYTLDLSTGEEGADVLDRRDAALRHHRTQVSVYQGYYALSNDVAAKLPAREGYARWFFGG